MPRAVKGLKSQIILGICELAHQHDQIKSTKHKLDWTWLIQHRRGFNTTPRGNFLEDFGVDLVPYYEKGKYDIAMLHLDQQCLDETLLERGKGSLYKDINEVITDIPKLVLCHGTPYWPERYTDIEQCSMMKDLIGNNHMLVNSYTARLQWAYGVKNTKAIKEHFSGKYQKVTKAEVKDELNMDCIGVDLDQITALWHGIDAEEYPMLRKDPRVITMISAAGLDKYYDRNFLSAVKEELAERNIQHCHITVDIKFKDFKEYSTFLGSSLIYFNPTKESCMPRARTEAMLAGCCVITTDNQDEEIFIEHGKNGFIVPRKPEEVADLIETLLLEYKTAEQVGKAAHETAIKEFAPARYSKQFIELVTKIANI